MDESRWVSDRHITTKLWRLIYAPKRDNLKKLCEEMLLRLQWQTENPWQAFGLGPGFFFSVPTSIKCDQI